MNTSDFQGATRLQYMQATAVALDYMFERYEADGYVPIQGWDEFLEDWHELRDRGISNNKASSKLYNKFGGLAYAKYFNKTATSGFLATQLDRFANIAFYPMRKKTHGFWLITGSLLELCSVSIIKQNRIAYSSENSTLEEKMIKEENFRITQMIQGIFGL